MTEITIINPLSGHTSQDTAYRIEGYPYGRLRCSKRYWLEYKNGFGFRLCSQTTNPKKPGDYWTAVKCSTYTDLAVMGLNPENNYVTWVGIGMYDHDMLEKFAEVYGASFDATQRGVFQAMLAAKKRYDARKKAATAETIALATNHTLDRE